jgi:hypothetical protein
MDLNLINENLLVRRLDYLSMFKLSNIFVLKTTGKLHVSLLISKELKR